MTDRDSKPNDNKTGRQNNKLISVIYNKENDSPKYFELKKSSLVLFVIGLPTITLIALVLGGIGLVHTSPFHLIDNYKQNLKARDIVSKNSLLLSKIQNYENEIASLNQKLAEGQPKQTNSTSTPTIENTEINKPVPTAEKINLPGLASLSLFKAVQGQKDQRAPAVLTLTEFKVIGTRDTTNLQFNIIPTTASQGKLTGHIIVVMKNELTIQVYPQHALETNELQISYLSGEPFSTQLFRPVSASFFKPRKAGNYTFGVYIFAKNGDLLHFESIQLPVRF